MPVKHVQFVISHGVHHFLQGIDWNEVSSGINQQTTVPVLGLVLDLNLV